MGFGDEDPAHDPSSFSQDMITRMNGQKIENTSGLFHHKSYGIEVINETESDGTMGQHVVSIKLSKARMERWRCTTWRGWSKMLWTRGRC